METIKGLLQEKPLLTLLQSAEAEGRTGVLLVSREHRARSFFLQDGLIVSCRGALPDPPTLQGGIRQPLHQQVLGVVREVNTWQDGGFIFTGRLPDQCCRSMETCRVSDIMSDLAPPAATPSCLDDIQQRIMKGDVEIPPLPDTMFKVHRCLSDEESSSEDLVKLLEIDQVLTTTLLKVVNSAFYSLANPVKSIQQALVYLGYKTVEGIIVAQTLSCLFVKNRQAIRQVLRESFGCALLAKKIAAKTGLNQDDAFVCGLLHNIGQTLLLNLAGDYDLPRELTEQLARKEHQRVGVLLAARWNLPEMVVETIENLEVPQESKSYGALIEAVLLARTMLQEPERVTERLVHCQQVDLPLEEVAALAELVPSVQDLAAAVA